MREPASLYVILGLEPGADRAAVEQAYRRLIKRHHPDRSGGDAAQAAEINRAYFELRRHQQAVEPPAMVSRRRQPRRARRRRGRLWPLLVVLTAATVLVGWKVERVPRWVAELGDASVAASGPARAVSADSASLDGPLNQAAVAGAIGEAVGLIERDDAEELAQRSRDCHRQMRARPELAQLDRCAAFDDAVVAAADGELDDRGVFGASAVTARHMTAGRLLSSDYLAIERRLDRVRLSVELKLRAGA
jgi:hypothetical protein